MAWILTRHSLFAGIFFTTALIISTSSVLALGCGYPGSPAYGRPVPVRDVYPPNSAVGFSCALGYTLIGNLKRICQNNGTWSGATPICDRSLPGMDQHASSRATLETHDAQKAIDGHRETCTYTDKKRPRWIRVDLRKSHLVQAVSVTVPKSSYHADSAHFTIYVISVKDATTANYHKCADFNGKFTTPTVKLPCNGMGIQGSYVHIEDNRKNLDYFSICEIEIFVQKDNYDCGEPDRPANSYTTNPEAGIVEYRCMHGYQLLGTRKRQCLPNGQWSDLQPLCKEVICPPLKEVPHGNLHYVGPARNRAQQGTVANVSCDYGFYPGGNTLQCMETGQWSDGTLTCKPVDCKAPITTEYQYLLMNGTTTYGSMALLYCPDQEQDEDENSTEVITCREDGTWSPRAVISCVHKNKDGASTLGLVEEENLIPNGVIIGMAVVVFFLLLVLILILLIRRKQLMRRNSTESIPSKATTSSTESKTVLPYENDAFYASITMEEQKPNPSEEKTQNVERGILSSILFAKRKLQKSDKAKENKDSSSANAGNCFYEEVGRTGRPGSNDDEPIVQPVYAQVDLEEKRRSRLAKSLSEQLDCSEKATVSEVHRTRDYEFELDSEPIKLRELPPIPDDDQSSGTYASLSRPPEPPPTPSLMRTNELYSARRMDGRYIEDFVPTMKDNELYSS